MDEYFFYYDLKTKKVLNECTLTPREVLKENQHWLWALNTRHPIDTEDDSEEEEDHRVGKWMLFVLTACVNYTWKRIKEAVKENHLWEAKVSTYDPNNKSHAIMIYTRDYTDLKDVISVLDYLETSGLKASNTIIKYKTDKQTLAGIYRGGKQKPWIYSSDTIRNEIQEH